MADEARAMLDALMGGDRNAPLPEGSALADPSSNVQGPRRTKRSCFDRDICPLYCAWGVDVYELFRNTKSDTLVGVNPNVVDDAAREEFVALPKQEQERLGYESMLFRKLQDLVQKCDRTVNRNKEKLRQEMNKQLQKRGGEDFVNDVDDGAVAQLASSKVRLEFLKQDIVDLTEKLEKSHEAENNLQTKLDTLKKEENGSKKEDDTGEKKEETKVSEDNAPKPEETTETPNETAEESTEAQEEQNKTETTKSEEEVELEESLEKARIEKQRLLVELRNKMTQHEPLEESIATQTRQLHYVKSDITSDKTVCEISGNFMSARDADERIAAHYAGKQYVGWKLVRDKLKAMQKIHGRYGPPGPPPPRRDGGYGGGGGGYRGRGGGDRYNDRDRSRDRGGYRRRSPSPPYWERRGSGGGGGYRGNDRGGGDWRRDRGGGGRDRHWRR